MLKVGQNAPEFSLQDQYGNVHNLKDYLNKGKKILIYFYPKDSTPGCTTESCSFRDSKEDLEKMGLIVFGVSKDSVSSHKKFSDKYELNFPILSDESTEMIKSYGVWRKKKFMGREYMGIERMSFLISSDGKIEKIYEEVKPNIHVEEVRGDLV